MCAGGRVVSLCRGCRTHDTSLEGVGSETQYDTSRIAERRGRILLLGIPRMPTHKAHTQIPAYQSVKYNYKRYISVLLKIIVTCLRL